MLYPADHFPETLPWAQAAVQTAMWKTGVAPYKWTVPLEAIGRYESNWGNNANLCNADQTLPVGAFQLSRGMFASAHKAFPNLVAQPGRIADPEVSAIVAILYINSQLPGYGGYGGITQLVDRTDRGPGNVLRAWIADPAGFTVEGARSLYEGY